MHTDAWSLSQLRSCCIRNIPCLIFRRFSCNRPRPDYKSHMVCRRLRDPSLSSSSKMRRRFLGLLLTLVAFGASATAFVCRRSHLRRALAAETAEDASTTYVSTKILSSEPSAVSERKASAPPSAKESASFPTKHSHSTAPPLASETRETAEKERPSVAGRGRSESRSLRQDDGRDDNLKSKEGPLLSSRTPA